MFEGGVPRVGSVRRFRGLLGASTASLRVRFLKDDDRPSSVAMITTVASAGIEELENRIHSPDTVRGGIHYQRSRHLFRRRSVVLRNLLLIALVVTGVWLNVDSTFLGWEETIRMARGIVGRSLPSNVVGYIGSQEALLIILRNNILVYRVLGTLAAGAGLLGLVFPSPGSLRKRAKKGKEQPVNE